MFLNFVNANGSKLPDHIGEIRMTKMVLHIQFHVDQHVPDWTDPLVLAVPTWTEPGSFSTSNLWLES